MEKCGFIYRSDIKTIRLGPDPNLDFAISKPRVSMHDHVSSFEKLLANLKNLDEDIKDEIKAMILLH